MLGFSCCRLVSTCFLAMTHFGIVENHAPNVDAAKLSFARRKGFTLGDYPRARIFKDPLPDRVSFRNKKLSRTLSPVTGVDNLEEPKFIVTGLGRKDENRSVTTFQGEQIQLQKVIVQRDKNGVVDKWGWVQVDSAGTPVQDRDTMIVGAAA